MVLAALALGSVFLINARPRHGSLALPGVYTLSPGYAVSIHGTVGNHSWSEKIEKVSGDLEGRINADGSADLKSIRMTMNARSVRGDMGPAMNKKTYKALKADDYPDITFLLTVPARLAPVDAGEKAAVLQGKLTLAGVSLPVIMIINSFKSSKGVLSITGDQKIRMTDFGIKPPSVLFGTVRASPDIRIDFKMDFTINQP